MRSGIVALIGKPNVGKSTLLNELVGRKVSIVAKIPQTTRRRVLGFVLRENLNLALVDTPGIHEPTTRLGKAMVDQARSALSDVDGVVVVVDGGSDPDDLDRGIASLIKSFSSEAWVLVCINKMDRLPAHKVLSRVEAYCRLFETDKYVLTCATKKQNLELLLSLISEGLTGIEPLFPLDEFTDQPVRFMAAELIREQALLAARQEVPHAVAVRIESWIETDSGLIEICATLLVERPGQKAILIGKGGAMVKQIGTEARKQIEELVGSKVFLDLRVAVRENWRMSPSALKDLEYT
jgi:GTP-binding protein Era